MLDLKRRLPLGSALQGYIGTKDRQPVSFQQWLGMVQQFGSTPVKKAKTKHLQQRRVEDQIPIEDDGAPLLSQIRVVEDVGETRQLHDSRMSAGGLKKGTPAPKKAANPASPAAVEY